MRSVALSIAIALSAVSSPAVAQQTCKPVVGHFEATVQPPDQCPGVLCTAGRVWGGIQGTYRFVMTTLQPSLAVPTIMFFTGESEVTTKSGDLVLGTDTGSIDVGPNGGFASLITFHGGTGDYAGATGQIRLRGELDPAAGITSGDYIGTLCTP